MYPSGSFVHNQFDQESECNYKTQIYPSLEKKNETNTVINSDTTLTTFYSFHVFGRF